MKRVLYIIILILSTSIVYSQDTVFIKTSAQCDMCKSRIEKRLSKVDGVISSSLNVENKLLTVVYKKTEINLNEIEVKVTEIGYDANELKAKKAAYKRLPSCCRKEYKGTH